MRILVLALSGIGDALMFTPALQLIKKICPLSEIDSVVMFKGVKDIYERTNLFNKIFFFDFLNEGFLSSLKFIFSLRKKYDCSINVYPSNRKEYNIISFLIGAKKRAGTNYIRMNFQNLSFLNNIHFQENDSLHNVQENIKLCEKLLDVKFNDEPNLIFPLTNEDLNFKKDFLISNEIKDDDYVIGFHPGCSTLKNHTKRRWEPEKFSDLGKKLIENKNCKILIFGGPEENELKNFICKKINSERSIAVKANNLSQAAAVMTRCNLFVTNDSSLMHIASALQLNVIAIIGPTSSNYIHPWKTKHKIVSLHLDCSPCFVYSPKPLSCSRKDVQFKCIKELEVEKVYEEINNFIKH